MSRTPSKDTQEERDRSVTLTNHTVDTELNTVTTTGTNKQYGQVPKYNSTKLSTETVVVNDLIGYIENPTGGAANPPQYTIFKTIHYAYSMRNTGETNMHFKFHPNHDWDIANSLPFDYHLHFATNAAAETGTVVFTPVVCVAKRDGTFTSDVTLVNISYTFAGASDQYKHQVVEIPMGRSTPTANQIDTADVDVDSMIFVHLKYDDALSTVADNTSIFVFQSDLHYQSYGAVGTRLAELPWN